MAETYRHILYSSDEWDVLYHVHENYVRVEWRPKVAESINVPDGFISYHYDQDTDKCYWRYTRDEELLNPDGLAGGEEAPNPLEASNKLLDLMYKDIEDENRRQTRHELFRRHVRDFISNPAPQLFERVDDSGDCNRNDN